MYATLADLLACHDERDLIQLTDQSGAGVIDQARVDNAIRAASVIIDGHVAVKYRLGQPAPLLTEIAVALAYHRLCGDTPPDAVVDAKKDAMAMLAKIAAGTIKLDQGEEQLPARPGAIVIAPRERHFSRDQMDGF